MRTVGRGLFMGLADAVPGVSGGTVAFLLGIHTRLVAAIAALGKLQFRELPWLLRLGLGIAIGLVLGSRVILVALERETMLAAAALFGLVVGSIPRAAQGATSWVYFLLGTGLAVVLSTTPLAAPDAFWFLPVAGAIAACAMILPGISGAFLLLLMGLYERVIHAVGHLEFRVLLPLAAGAGVGLLIFTRGLTWLLDKHPGRTRSVLVGLLVGALVRLWPWRDSFEGSAQAMTPGTLGAVMVGAAMAAAVAYRLGTAPPKAT